MPKELKLDDLVGLHDLSGVSFQEDSVLFILDGVTYKAVENSSDGYRSYCEDLVISQEKVLNTFPPQRVEGVLLDEGYIRFVDVQTNKEVLDVGTDHVDAWYPTCIMHWYPENLYINMNKGNNMMFNDDMGERRVLPEKIREVAIQDCKAAVQTVVSKYRTWQQYNSLSDLIPNTILVDLENLLRGNFKQRGLDE